MSSKEKREILKKHQFIATGLLILMAAIFLISFFVPDTQVVGYVRSFSEAAMVGALADWFAVTALFRHPLGLPIPHTNLIESNKNNIGKNFGHFISENFLNAANIKPRLANFQMANKLGNWLQKPANRQMIIQEVSQMAQQALAQLKDEDMQSILEQQFNHLLSVIDAGKIAGDTLEGILQKNIHQEWITILASNAAAYMAANEQMVKEKVKEESHFLIPGFIDNLIASKISKGIQNFLAEIARDNKHPQRQQITGRLQRLALEMKTSELWEERFSYLKTNLLPAEKLQQYSGQLWQYIKNYLFDNISKENGTIHNYLHQTITRLANEYLSPSEKSRQLDLFLQVQLLKIMLRHREEVSRLISTTIANWESQSLSQKLELEVGKDLQFIRLNGTIVGGIVGLIIHAISLLL